MRKESSSAKILFIAIIVLFCVLGFSTNSVLGEAAAVEEKTEAQSQPKPAKYITLLPSSPIRSLKEYHHTYRTYPAPVQPLYKPLPVPACDFEIRRAKDQKRIARIPFTGYFRRHGEPGESDRRRVGQLPDGEYLVALCVGNARCSNVAKIKIDSGWEPKKEPALRLIGFPLGPGQKLPYLGLQAVGPTPQDPELMNDMIAFANLIVDGVIRTPKMMLWVGPVAPLKPERIYTRILDLNNYEPAIEPGLRHRVKARVGKYESEIAVIPADDLLGKAWNRATPTLEPALPPQIVLEGQVIGPIAHWAFEEGRGSTVYDWAGNNDGTVHGAKWTTGKVGRALSFDGVDDYVSILDAMDPLAYTLTAWVNPNSVSAQGIIVRTSPRGPIREWSHQLLISSSGKFEHYLYCADGTALSVTFDRPIVVDTWYHIAAVAENNRNMRLYVNGEEQGTAQRIGWLWNGGDRWYIGSNASGLGYFRGLIDEVAIYDRALSAKEIQQLYQQGTGGLVAHWKFEEGSGTTVHDSIGNNHATIHGAKWTTGRVGGALSFDGVDDYVDCGNDPLFDITGPITLTAWLKTSSGSSVWQGIVTKGEVLWKIQKHVSGSGDFECWGLIGAPPPGPYLSTVGVNMNDGQWHHIAGTYDGAAMRIYWDGLLNNSFSVSGTINTGSYPVYIGGVYGKPEYGFPGVIDDVRIYNRALSAEEIRQLYRGKAAEPPVSFVTMTALGVMFEFRPSAGRLGWIDMELYEHGGEMLAAFSCPHSGEPIQIWLAEPVDQNEPAKYYLRYRIRITAAPLPKWRVVGVSRMPRTTRTISDKNTPSTPVPAKEMGVKIPMSHGPMKDGLAAFLICGQNQFRVSEPITVMLGIAYLRQSKVQMSVWSPSRAKDGLTSWFSIKDPDGKEISYESGRGNYFIPDPNKYAAHLRLRQFVGRYESLKKYHDFIKPGIYTIKWNYRAHPADFWWQGELVSNEIQIEILAVDDCELESSRKTLLLKDLTTRYGLWVPVDDPRLKAIEQLRSAASPEAVAILREFLTAHRVNCQELKQHALVALGKIGTEPAIEAVRQFEAWCKKCFTKPPPFRFGFKDHAIDHFAPQNLTPLAKTTDEKNRTWAIFQWARHSAVAETWICKSLGEALWSQPILLNFPGMPEFNVPQIGTKWDEKCSFQIKNGSIKITVGDKIWQSRISDHLVDSDKDGVPDPVEARLLTDPKVPDSDKDGLPDGKDSNPLTPKHSDTNDVIEIRQAVFSALCATGNSQDAIVIVDRDDFAKQEYYGYGGAVLRSTQTRNGFINITGIRVKIESPTTATAIISDWEGNLAASGHEAKLKKINGKWVVVEFKMTWIS